MIIFYDNFTKVNLQKITCKMLRKPRQNVDEIFKLITLNFLMLKVTFLSGSLWKNAENILYINKELSAKYLFLYLS